MPTYEYRCKNCGRRSEIFQNITDGKLRKCSACGRFSLERLIGAGAGIIFKGNGFYQTDYARKSTSCSSCPHEKCPAGAGGDKEASGSSPSKDSSSD